MEPEANNEMQRAGICLIGLLAAASALWSDTNEKCGDMLSQALDSKNPETRKHAVVALSLADRGPLFWRLTHMLGDRDVEVRIAVVTSLSEQKAPDAIDALKKALRDRTPEVSFAAAKALYHLDDLAGKEALLAVLGRQPPATSSGATRAARKSGLAPAGIAVVAQGCSLPDPILVVIVLLAGATELTNEERAAVFVLGGSEVPSVCCPVVRTQVYRIPGQRAC